MSSPASAARTLYGAPVLLQDWDSQAEEGAAKYWELFLDLLMVAAASAVADGLKDDPTIHGVVDFSILFLLFVNSWMLYTHHITTRFEDTSFVHALKLFVFIVGTCICITNATLESSTQVRYLAFGVLMQLVSILAMLLAIKICIPRAHWFCALMMQNVGLYLAIITLAIFFPGQGRLIIGLAILFHFCCEMVVMKFISPARMIPINIEHTKDRLGVLMLVMIGETIISSTIEYRLLTEKEYARVDSEYYWVLFWALMGMFFFNLLYFQLTPAPAMHALRRSIPAAVAALYCHKIMCGSLLAVGSAVKLTLEAVLEDEELSPFCRKLWCATFGCCLVSLLGMRLAHYGGRVPSGNEPPAAQRLMYIWWLCLAIACFLPFVIGVVFYETPWMRNPVKCVATYYAVLLFCICFVESWFMHVLEPLIGVSEVIHGSSEHGGGSSEETQHLAKEAAAKQYDSTS